MRERGIILRDWEVRALAAGRKTQLRRPLKPQPSDARVPGDAGLREWASNLGGALSYSPTNKEIAAKVAALRPRIFPFRRQRGNLWSPSCPFGMPGDRLWVRETWGSSGYQRYEYRAHPADGRRLWRAGWKSAAAMPRHVSRYTLEVVDVRVERAQDISEDDAKAEGCAPTMEDTGGQDLHGNWVEMPCYAYGFCEVWDKDKPKKGQAWTDNPWVWVVTFRRLGDAQNQDQSGAVAGRKGDDG